LSNSVANLFRAFVVGARDGDTVVAVAHPHDSVGVAAVVAPCGMCRELISDVGREAWVIVPDENVGR
jgi:cytidine deaminase